MVTLSDIKNEHRYAEEMVRLLISRLNDSPVPIEERRKLIDELSYWNTVEDYLHFKYKEKERE